MAKVSLKNVSKNYPDGIGEAVSDVSLDFENRELCVLTGPVNSGATTLLRIIAGLEQASSGEILIDDRRVNELKPRERDVAMVFPDAALYPSMSARDNIAFGLRMRKFSTAELARRVEDAALVLGILDLLEIRPKELTALQRQRVSIARAIARQPKVLLFDDPLTNLETAVRAEMRAEIRKLHDRLQTATIYATRDTAEGMTIGDRLVVLSEGKVQQSATPRTLYDSPANLFVARVIGDPPINLIRGTLKIAANDVLFSEEGEGTVQVRFPLSQMAAIDESVNKTVMLGIRPEDVEIIALAKGQEGAGSGFPAIVDLVEEGGSESRIHLQTGAHTILSRDIRRALPDGAAGRRIRFRFEPDKVHLFDPVSTVRIGRP